jgi:phage portal protein BeeE
MSWRELLSRTGKARAPRVSGGTPAGDPIEAHRRGELSFRDAAQRLTGKSSSEFIVLPPTGDWLPSLGFQSNNIDEAYAASTWAYSCMTANARSASRLPAIPQTRDPDGTWKRAPAHELNRLLSVPFAGAPRWPAWDWAQLTQTGILQRYVCGNNYLKPAVDAQRLLALFPLMKPKSVKAIENTSDGLLDGWDLGAGRGKLPLNQLCNIMAPTAGSLWQGVSPLGVSEEAVTVDSSASARQRAATENRADPGLILVVDDVWGEGLTTEQETAALLKLKTRYTSAADAGTPLIFSKGTEIHAPPNMSPVDLAIYDARKFSREEILAVFMTPPPMIGIYDQATLNNFSEAFRIWWLNVLFPLLEETYRAINSQVIWPLYGTDTRLWYDPAHSDIGVLLQSAKLEVAKKIRDLGYTANDATTAAGLDMEYVKELQIYNTDLTRAGRDGATE